MTAKRLIVTSLMAAIAITPVTRATAGDALAGGIIGGIIGGVIVNEASKNRRKRVYSNTTSSATRAANREVQTSLNYFSFPAGTPDGVMGRNSRNAVAQYQAYLGYPATGRLSLYERDFLVTSYHRAIAGGPATNQLIATNQQGTRGLLVAYRNQIAGVSPNPVAPVAVSPQVVAPVVADAPVVSFMASETTEDTMPSFMGQANSLSLASHCNTISLLTNSNGGFVTEVSMSDPNLALNEQFCLARTYAIAQGEELIAKVQGFSADQIAKQCATFGPLLKDHVAGMSLKSQQQVLQDVGQFVLKSGMSPAQLSGTAKICLSVGYRTDDMDVAIGSGLLLVVLGHQVYSELMGHHLTQGIGASQRFDLAQVWYKTGLDALENGATAVFAPGQPDRNSLIREASFRLNGGVGTSSEATTMPVFNVEQ